MAARIKCLEDISNFTIRLGGKDSIDAIAFNKIIEITNSLLQECVSIAAPGAFVRLNIKSNSKGSFLTSLDIIVKEHYTLLHYGKEVIKTAVASLTVFYTLLQIKKHFKGEKATNVNFTKEINTYTIINIDNESLDVPKETAEKFFKDETIDSSISELFKEVKKEERTFFEFIPDKKSRLNRLFIESCNFDNMAKNVIDTQSITHILQPPITVNLLIKQVDFIGDSSWGFIYNKAIKARIKDKIFLERIRTGEITLGAGYQLNCSLQIEYDLQNGEIIKDTEKYTVLEVFDILEPEKPKQKELFETLS